MESVLCFFCFCFSCFLYTLLEVLILFVMKLSFGLLSFSVRALLLWVLSFSEVDLVDLRGVNLFLQCSSFGGVDLVDPEARICSCFPSVGCSCVGEVVVFDLKADLFCSALLW